MVTISGNGPSIEVLLQAAEALISAARQSAAVIAPGMISPGGAICPECEGRYGHTRECRFYYGWGDIG